MPPLTGATLDTLPLSVEQTVPRSWVHKRSIENVLVTEIRAAGENRFLCAGRIPTAHGFFNGAGRTPRTDILFYTELGRQASLAISHAFLGVTSEDTFIFEGSEAAITAAAWRATPGAAGDLVLVEVSVTDATRRRNSALSRAVTEHVMWIGGEVVFRGTGAWTVQPAALYQRLRRGAAARSTPHDAPDVQGPSGFPLPEYPGNRVISPIERQDGRVTATLIVDERHPYFFDHPCDHVPGMLLLEGCAQIARAAIAAAGSTSSTVPAVGGYDVNFAQFVECGVPATLMAEVTDAGSPDAAVPPTPGVQVTILQRQAVAGTTTMRLRAGN